jgi:hypothetical protein
VKFNFSLKLLLGFLVIWDCRKTHVVNNICVTFPIEAYFKLRIHFLSAFMLKNRAADRIYPLRPVQKLYPPVRSVKQGGFVPRTGIKISEVVMILE